MLTLPKCVIGIDTNGGNTGHKAPAGTISLPISIPEFAENLQHGLLDVTIKIQFNSYMGKIDDRRGPNRAASLNLRGGNLALDFANTQSGRDGPQHLNHIHSAADIAAWAQHAGVVDELAAMRVIMATNESQAELLAVGQVLREAIYQINFALAEGRPPGVDVIQELVGVHRKTLEWAELEGTDGRYTWHWEPRAQIEGEILGPIAEAAVGLLMHGDHSRIKQCKGKHCGWLFYDSSKNNSRQWCDMNVCGNRAKMRAFRKRRAEPETPDGLS
jgi:predicted RNA-binding Zn ribbon-like protein